MARSPRRVLVLGLVMWVVVGGMARIASARSRDPLAVAAAALSDRSEKVRIQAVLVLGRMQEPRVVPILIRALGDVSPAVRAMAAKGLGQSGDDSAREPLQTAANDPDPMVRRHATAALELLARASVDDAIAVMPMGDRTHRASPHMRERMRELVTAEVERLRVQIRGGYAVDGVIKTLAVSNRANLIEVTCSVELVVSTKSGSSIVLMSTGEAIVQKERRLFRPTLEPSMEMEAMENAVRGASEELRQHFAKR